MIPEQELTFPIRSEVDVLMARRGGMRLVGTLGFSEIDAAAIEIILSELGTNIVKHGGSSGTIRLRFIVEPDRSGLEIRAANQRGVPGILEADGTLRMAVFTGRSTAGTLGIGLSGVRRLADGFDIGSTPAGCLEITAWKWLMRVPRGRVKVSVLSRPRLGERVSGDGYWMKDLWDGFFFSVIDGLGHGFRAHDVTRRALAALEMSFQKPLADVMDFCHAALLGSRGAAVAVGRIEFDPPMLHHISIGNVTTRIFQGGVQVRTSCQNGTIGVALGRPQTNRYPLLRNACIISTTDGISEKYDMDGPELGKSVQEIAHGLFSHYARNHDDATVLVARVVSE